MAETEYTIDPSSEWAEWEDDAWHPDDVDVWEHIGEVLNDALDYLGDAGYC